jgi:sec-independent protein translocase protein TatA
VLTGLLQPSHLIVLLVVLLVVLGPKRLPEAGRAVGRGLREFKNSIAGDDDPGTQGTGEGGHEQAAALAGSTESESTRAPAEKA